jgi:plasmid stabilization system protein ParE
MISDSRPPGLAGPCVWRRLPGTTGSRGCLSRRAEHRLNDENSRAKFQNVREDSSAPSVEALDTPLGPHGSHRTSGVCYSALRCLPRRDLHPLEKNDGMRALARPHRHDATWSPDRTRCTRRSDRSNVPGPPSRSARARRDNIRENLGLAALLRGTGVGDSGRTTPAAVSLPVRTTPEADGQIREIDDWWRSNRPAPAELFLTELTASFDVLAHAPHIGRSYRRSSVPDTRRLLLEGTRYHVTMSRALILRDRVVRIFVAPCIARELQSPASGSTSAAISEGGHMKQRLTVVAAVVLILGAIGMYSFRSSGQQPAPQVQRLQVNIVDVKPDMINAWIDFQTKQTVPALQKAGVARRDVYQAALGRVGRFIAVRPVGTFAERDSPAPLERALGAAGAREYNDAVRKMIADETTYVIQRIPDASYDPIPDAIYKILVLSQNHVAPGRGADYLNYVRTEILPLQQKAQAKRFLVSQIVFGGDPNTFGTATFSEKFADLDAGPATVRVLGQDGAAKLAQKTVGIVMSIEREVFVRNDVLSFRARPTT